MFSDLLKHQSMSKINPAFLTFLRDKYKNPVKVAPYIVERLIHSNINTVFSNCRYNCSPFIDTCFEYNNFNVVFTPYTNTYIAKSIIYAQENKGNQGVVINNSHNNINKNHLAMAYHNKIPIVLLSFFNNNELYKVEKHFENLNSLFKENYTVQRATTVPNTLEYMLMLSNLPSKGLVHLKIPNEILDKEVNL